MKALWIKWLVVSIALLLAGCSAWPSKKAQGPKDWSLHAFVPKYSPAYVAPAIFTTTDNKGGAAMNADYPPQTKDPNGWEGVSVDGTYGIEGALPKEIKVTWTPLATKETWTAHIKVPQALRDAMIKSHKYRDLDGSIGTGWHLTSITVGVTPNGYARLFLIGSKGTIPRIKTRSYAMVKGKKTPKLTPYIDKDKNIGWPEGVLRTPEKAYKILHDPMHYGHKTILSMKYYPEAQAYIAKHGISQGPW